MSLYEYCAGGPYGYIDPIGLSRDTDFDSRQRPISTAQIDLSESGNATVADVAQW